MRFLLWNLAALAAVLLAGSASAASSDDTIQAKSGPITVHAIHHASLMLSWQGKHVLVDPAPLEAKDVDAIAAYKALPTPDVILITHIHGDHFNVAILEAIAGPKTMIVAPQVVVDALPAALKARATAMGNGGMLAFTDIPDGTLMAVPMQNVTAERLKFHPAGQGNGYIVGVGGKQIYIAGDTEETPVLAKLKNIDVAFVPMNLPYTETVEAAAKWVTDFKPKIVYPYHYRNADGTKSDLTAFKTQVGGASEVRFLNWY